jgi:hypothetical protein
MKINFMENPSPRLLICDSASNTTDGRMMGRVNLDFLPVAPSILTIVLPDLSV